MICRTKSWHSQRVGSWGDARFLVRLGRGRWSRGFGRLLLPGEAVCVDLGEDVELDEAFQFAAGAFDVLRQQFVVEGFADITGSEGAGGVVGQVGRGGPGREPVRESSDGLPGDRQVFEVGLGLLQPGLQFGDLCAEIAGQGPGGVLLRSSAASRS